MTKRVLAWVACCAVLGAWAEEPGDYSDSATLTPEGGDALQRFVLPFEVYRDAQWDMADVRVFNARGEPVPIARAGDPEPVKEATRSVSLAQFAVSRLTAAPGGKGTEVTVRTGDGTLVEVRGQGAGGAKAPVPVAYLLDASQLKEPLTALVFDWNAAPGTEVVRVTVESSDDLQNWHHAGHGSLLRLTQGDRVLEQRRAELHAAINDKYYRVTWTGTPEFELRSATGEYAGTTRRAERSMATVVGAAGEKPGEFVFDLGARLPVEALRIVPAEPNSVATFMLFARDKPLSEWRTVTSAVFYRLERGGAQVESGPVEISRYPARYWMARVDPNSGGIGSTPPKLEAQWRDGQVIFAARGPGPFRLAFGARDPRSAWVNVATLIPGYQRGDELKLPEAKLGPVEGAPRAAASGLPAIVDELGPRKIALWSILVIGVLVLGGMAWRLSRQMGSESGVGAEGQGRGSE
jgi:hypothetical protein